MNKANSHMNPTANESLHFHMETSNNPLFHRHSDVKKKTVRIY